MIYSITLKEINSNSQNVTNLKIKKRQEKSQRQKRPATVFFLKATTPLVISAIGIALYLKGIQQRLHIYQNLHIHRAMCNYVTQVFKILGNCDMK